MARTETLKIPLGYKAPDFKLLNTVSGREMTLGDLKSEKATVVMFICNHCPFVKHIQQGLVDLANDYIPKGVSFIAISSNDVVNYPDDSPEKMKEVAQNWNYPFPYLYDETQDVARAYEAVCTPDFSIFDSEMKCVYRGQLDDSRPESSIPVTGKDIRVALDLILERREVSAEQKPSIGCNIKWK
ncbi:MAG: thioredoxin family protein [Flavobacteriales bacterium]|nr:MAG: thioredoxin family protein [Flavobacteriales bacterium]